MSSGTGPAGNGSNRSAGNHRSVLWWLGWPWRQVLIGMLIGYRRFVSPLLPPSCRYHPSCSTYALQAIRRHGAAKGSVLTVWRVLRCNPWSKGGVDPVPRRGRWRPEINPDGSPRSAPTST